MDNKQNLITSQKIRESYTRLPLQGFWSWLTGKELHYRAKELKGSVLGALVWSTKQSRITYVEFTSYSL